MRLEPCQLRQQESVNRRTTIPIDRASADRQAVKGEDLLRTFPDAFRSQVLRDLRQGLRQQRCEFRELPALRHRQL